MAKPRLPRQSVERFFDACAQGDVPALRQLLDEDPSLVRASSAHGAQYLRTGLHAAAGRADLVRLLLDAGSDVHGTGDAHELDVIGWATGAPSERRDGADLEARNLSGQTALETAMLHGDQEAAQRLVAAGAPPPKTTPLSNFRESVAKLEGRTTKCVAAIAVADIAATLDWYTSIGFKEIGRWQDDGVVNWGMTSFGDAELMFGMHGKPGRKDVTLWLYTDAVDELYQLFKARQFEALQSGGEGIEFEEDIYDPFYGGRQFSIRDPNGYGLIFYKEG